jgi:hypothetical protein
MKKATKLDMTPFAETVVLAIKRALDQPQARLAALEAHCQSLEQRVKKQDARILELEAQRVADHVR